MPKPLVALVGRPNVGKSRLFNRLIGQRKAIVADRPGTTRDRLYAEYQWNGRDVALVDTGGLTSSPQEDVQKSAIAQANVALDEADVIILVTDVRDGVSPVDEEIAIKLRQGPKPVVLAVNKADNKAQMDLGVDFYALGLGDPVPISAERGLGTGDLLDSVDALLASDKSVDDEGESVRLAIVGRPNVGKSSLVNTLLGQSRVIVSEIPGTTRDAVDTDMTYEDKRFTLIDTAGIRRPGKVAPGIEKYSVLRAHRAIDRTDVAALIVDATELLAAQDAHIAGFVEEEGKGLVIVVNKWDLIEKTGTTINSFERRLREELKFVDYAPIVFVSAITKQRTVNILDIAASIAGERTKRITTGPLNDAIQKALRDNQPPSRQGKRLQLLYATQTGVAPPTIVIFCNDPSLVHFSYKRFLENRIRERFGFMGTPIRLVFRARHE